MTETARLADQIRRAFNGDAWHGPSVLELLADVDAVTAAARPLSRAHSIWEIVLHIQVWDDVVLRRLAGEVVQPSLEQDFPHVADTSEAAWRKTVERLKQTHDALVQAAAAFPEARLEERVNGKSQAYYTFYYMLSGIPQHELYHAGQIALLKKARG